MSQSYSISLGVPGCYKPVDEETKSSKYSRITAVALGAIALTLGLLSFLHVPGLHHLGTIGAISFTASGSLLLVAAFVIRYVKTQTESLIENQETSNLTLNKKKTTQTKLPTLHDLPENLFPYEILPTGYQSYCKQFPYKVSANASFKHIKLREAYTAPVTMYSGPSYGMVLRLRVEHILQDGSKIENLRCPESNHIKPSVSSDTPFTMFALAWKNKTNSDQWILSSEIGNWMTHREHTLPTSEILGDNSFSSVFSEDKETAIEAVKNFEYQDQLPREYQWSLDWILVRLFEGKSIYIREKRTDSMFHLLKDKPIGYWKLSLES